MDGTLIGAAAAGLGVAMLTTPAGVSGAVFLLPIQLGVLGVPSPAATPTNLLYNVIATPGGLLRWWRTGAVDPALTRLLVTAALPAVVVGAALRATVLSGRLAVLIMVGTVLTALGAWLLMGARAGTRERDPARAAQIGVAGLAGLVGGAYGIGGGSVIAPALVAMGIPAARAAPAALATTFATSVAGILAFEGLAAAGVGAGQPVGPYWSVGIALGLGGLVGTHVGARLHERIPERGLRRALGLVALAVGVAYLITAGA